MVGLDALSAFRAARDRCRIEDVDGNDYIDYLLGLGPMIFGHRPPRVTHAVVDFIQQRGTVFALPTADEASSRRRSSQWCRAWSRCGLCNTGTEAVLYATRLARAFTGRNKIVRFEGMYHGFSDAVYWSKHPPIDKAGPDDRPDRRAPGTGLAEGVEDNLIILPWNDAQALGRDRARRATRSPPCSPSRSCATPAASCREPGYLEAMRELTRKPASC